jgi:hypothetical protein
MSGQVQVMFDTISSSFAHIKAGKLRALATTSVTRSAHGLSPQILAFTILELGDLLDGILDKNWGQRHDYSSWRKSTAFLGQRSRSLDGRLFVVGETIHPRPRWLCHQGE